VGAATGAGGDRGDPVANLAAVCPSHHRTSVPHGDRALVGNPQPDGLDLVELGDLTLEPAQLLGRPAPWVA